jgi:hypothetical protein
VNADFRSLGTLESLDADSVVRLRKLGINNLADLLAYQPFRHARYVRAACDRLLRREEVIGYIDDTQQAMKLEEMLEASTVVLRSVGSEQAEILTQIGLRTVAELAAYAAVEEAEEVVSRAPNEENDPFAPSCVLPTCKKFSRNTKSYSSFFKERGIRSLSVLSTGNSEIANLFRFGRAESNVIHLGYSVSYVQEWIYVGVHLGEPQGSVNLAMGQDTQVSMLDWRRAMRALRAEDTRISERLASTLFHQRAVDEVARATAEEHQHGATSAFGANAATAGSFVAAGAVVGGVGGGISGSLVGLSVDALTGGAALGLGTLSGAVVGTAVGSIAGAAAGSIIASGATTLGFVDTDAEGDREIFASSGQDIQQRTMQNSSSIRSFWSNIVSQNVEEEQQTIRTDRLTNHNRIHALNAILFEVLNGYRVNISAQGFAPILFLPFKPFKFSSALLRSYWWLIRSLLVDRKIVQMLDVKYLRLSVAPNTIDQLEGLPTIEEIQTETVTVSVNLDSSAIAETITNIAIATGLAVVGLVPGLIIQAFRAVFDATKRNKVRVKLVTTNGTVDLLRDNIADSDPDFIGRFSTASAVEVGSITAVRVINDNGEFEVLGVDLSSLKFDDVKSSIKIKNKLDFSTALPTLGQLEDTQTVSGEFSVGANGHIDLPWGIGEQLRAKFEGIDSLRAHLQTGKLEIEDAEQAEAALLDFLNANKFTFTRLILQGTEPEQIITVLEDVRIGDVDLSEIAGTTPIGFCANHVVLPMKASKIGSANFGEIGVETSKLEVLLREFEELDRKKPSDVAVYLVALRDFLKQFLHSAPGSGNGSMREAKLLDYSRELLTIMERVLDTAAGGSSKRTTTRSVSEMPVKSLAVLHHFDARIAAAIRKILALLQAPITSKREDAVLLCSHYDSVKASLAKRMGELLSTDEISLPSPAVFMEPVLSNAKGAELYDLRRNSHYELLESPSIAAADPNVLRNQAVTLTPTVPTSTLSVVPPPEIPLPSSLAAALGEAGKLNLGTLISSNATSLTSMLSNLSAVATELAKASAQLTGDAQKQALASATDVAKQVGDIVSKSLEVASDSPAAPAQPAPTPSPKTQQEKAEVRREAERIDQGGGSTLQKNDLKKTIGAVVTPDGTRDYQFSIAFLDAEGIPYTAGAFDFTLTLSFFELGTVVNLNGGGPIELTEEGFFFPERFTLTKGRKCKLSLVANIGGVLVPGAIDLPLPDSPDVSFECTMKSETREFQEAKVHEAVDTAVTTSGFGLKAGILLDLFLNAGVKFPFKLAEVTADGTIKPVIDLKGEYNKSKTATTGGTTTTTESSTYKVTTPLNGWTIVVS